MDKYTSKRVVTGLGATRKGPGLACRSNNEDQKTQYCNRIGCSTRPNSMKGSQIGSSDRVKSLRPASRSTGGKTIVGSSSKTYSATSNLRKSHKEPQKLSSHKETNAGSSSIKEEARVSELIPSISSVQTGFPEPVASKSIVLKSLSADPSQEVECYNLTSNTRPRKQIHQESEKCNQETSSGSSVRRSFASRNTSQVAKPVTNGQGANTNSYGSRNFGGTSISHVAPSGCLSSDSSRSRLTDIKKRSLYGESSSARGKSMSGPSISGNSGSQRSTLSRPSLSLSEHPPFQRASRKAKNRLPSRDGVSSVRTRRTTNGDTRTRLPELGNGNSSLLPPEPPVVISQLPQNETPVRETTPLSSSQQFSSEFPSDHQNSYSRPGSSRAYVHRRPIAHPEDGITRSFHGFSMDHDGFRPGIAGLLQVLERIEQDEELTYEQLLHLETNLFLGGLNFHDQHRDLRLDIDNMSYEELLALGEKMGTVSTALTEEALSNCLKRSCYIPAPSDSGTSGCGDDDVKCSICQEEYVVKDEVGKLGCEHRYHVSCIHKWLRQKNWCPICKAPAATS